jgi:predicted nucleotidyltransferase
VTLDEIADLVTRWAATEPLIRRAYLFGSRVKGTHRRDSDLDVAVVHDIDPAIRGIGETLRLDRQFTWEDHSPRWDADLGKLRKRQPITALS